MIKYFSDKLNKFFPSEQECAEAEKAHEEALAKAEAERKALNEKRSERAKEIEAAREELVKAKKHYNDLLSAFLADYGSYHSTIYFKNPSWFDFPWF